MLIWRLREQIAHELDVRGGRGSGGWLHTAGQDVSVEVERVAREAQRFLKKKSHYEEFVFELQDYPQGRDVGLDDFLRRLPAWEVKVKRRARQFWAWLDEVVDWSHSISQQGGAGEAGKVWVSRPRSEKMVLEGVPVVLVGYTDKDAPVLDQLKVVLRVYRQRAAKRYPILLKNELPFELSFETDPIMRNAPAARYAGTKIQVTPWGLAKDSVDSLVHMFAHEMGHHIFHLLNSRARRMWADFFRGGEKQAIDLRDVLARRREGEGDDKFIARLKKEDPLLYMRLGMINPRWVGYVDVSMIQAQMERDPIFFASTRLPTAYAAMAFDEAFPEVVGQLVGYGPRTVPREALEMLRIITPGGQVKMEQMEAV
jgi:hypothetical protein